MSHCPKYFSPTGLGIKEEIPGFGDETVEGVIEGEEPERKDVVMVRDEEKSGSGVWCVVKKAGRRWRERSWMTGRVFTMVVMSIEICM